MELAATSHNPMFVCISHRRQAAIMSLKRQLFADCQQSGFIVSPPQHPSPRPAATWSRPKVAAVFGHFWLPQTLWRIWIMCLKFACSFDLAVESHSWALHFATDCSIDCYCHYCLCHLPLSVSGPWEKVALNSSRFKTLAKRANI